jgi:fructokinase
MEQRLVLGVGELLWDLVPEAGGSASRVLLGGAPANFAVMAARLGNHAIILSRIGNDELGRRALDQLEPLPADSFYLQKDAVHETGRVTVAFEQGQPHYTIHQPAAWDFLESSATWLQLASRADALCYGSLAQRSPQSRQTILALVAQTPESCIRVFDVNLRAPFYSGEIIQAALELATVLKMNDAEAPLLLELLGLPPCAESTPHRLRRIAEQLLEEFPTLELVAITRGSQGSLLVERDEWHDHPGFPVKVADTIGAGDAFTAALTHYLLRGAELATLNEAGNRWGAWMAAHSGAMPALSDQVRAEIADAIES